LEESVTSWNQKKKLMEDSAVAAFDKEQYD